MTAPQAPEEADAPQAGREPDANAVAETASGGVDRQPARAPARARRRMRRAAGWAAGIVSLAGAVALGVALFVIDRPMAAPDWLRDRVETRLGAVWPEADVALGQLTFRLRPTLDVSVTIDDLALAAPDGTPLFDLARLDATLARRGLLRARLEAKQVSAAGLFASLDRGVDGRFDLAFGNNLFSSAPDFRSLLAAIDRGMEAPQFASLREVALEAVTLEYRDRAAGRTWLIDGGRVTAQRSADDIALRGDLALLSGGDDVATLAVTASSPLGDRAVSIGVALDNMPATDIATQSPALAWLGVLRAPISGALRLGVAGDGTLAPLNATLQIGAGVLQPSEATRPIPFEAARTYFTFDPAAARFDFTELSVTSDWVSGSGTGTALLRTDAAGGLRGLTGQVALTRLSGTLGAVFADAPRALQSLRADVQLGLAPFRLRVGQLTALAGALQIAGEADVRAAPDGWDVSALVQTPEATPAQLLAYWPAAQVPNTRDWIARNVAAARLTNLQAHLRVRPGAAPALYLGASLAGARVRALRDMPPVEIAAGRLTLEARELVLAADSATIDPGRGGVIDASGSRFRILDTRARPGEAEVHLRTEAQIEALLALLDNPPLELASRLGRPVDLAQGRAVLRTDLAFPLRPRIGPEAVDYAVRGRLRDLASDSLVPGRALRAAALDLTVTPEALRLSGAGTLSDVPFDGMLDVPLGGGAAGGGAAGGGALRAEVALSEAALGAFGVDLPPGTLSGQGTGALVVGFAPDAAPSFSLSSDLAGIGLSIAPLGWEISPATLGRFAIAGALGPRPRIDSVSLEAPRLQAQGRLSLAEGGGLARAEFDRLRVGGWLDAAVTLTPRGPGLPPALALRDGTIDLRALPGEGPGEGPGTGGSGGSGAAAPTPLRVDGLSLRISDTLRLDALRGDLIAQGGLSGDFTARVNGGAPISGRAMRRDGRTALDIASDDAGRVLRDAQIFPDMRGGAFDLRLRPAPAPGAFDGRLSIDQLRVRNAPAMAALLNAVSVVGLLDELTGQGIYFEEIDAEFRLGNGALTITSSSAVGPSMGLSLDGYYDLARRVMDFQGVVSPLYAVNILGRVIARRGEGLIGIAFTMAGPADAPQVSVNPLSALTPGGFREIFRRPPPSFDE